MSDIIDGIDLTNMATFRLFSMCTIGAIGFVGGLLPFVLVGRHPHIISMLNALSGGVFVSAGLVRPPAVRAPVWAPTIAACD